MTVLLEADVATVDNISIESGLRVVAKWSSVRTSTATNVDLSTALVNGATFSGVVVATGDRVLVRHQSTTSQNGIYIVAASGAASRASDADASGEFSDGKAVKINEGVQGGTYAKVSVPPSFTLGTSPIAFSTELFPGVVDGVDLADGDNVLLLNQDDPAENGLYTISSSSTAVRHASFNEESEFEAGVYIEVLTGGRLYNTLWRLFVEEAVELGVSPIQIFYYDRRLDFFRTQVSTGMYGLNAGTYGSIQNAAKRFLIGDRQIVIDPNVPNDYTITVRTILDETIGVDAVDLWTECTAATTADVDISVGLVNGSILDGITLATGNRILVKDQAVVSQNGIYVAQSSGAAVRASDADDSSEFAANKSVYVAGGTVNGESYFTVTTLPTTVGTDSIEFERSMNLGSSDVILKALEPTRPLGFMFNHETINKFAFTLDSSALGRIGASSLA